MAALFSRGFARVGGFLRREFVAAWPVFLFFLVGFLLLILLVKLALAEFSIEVRALSNAVVGALLAAKAALVLDETPLARSLAHHRRIVAVAVKTSLYGVAGLLLGYLERFLEALHKVRYFDAAVRYVIDHANLDRLLAWALGVSIVFALYFAFYEIGECMSEGDLWRLFFESRRATNGSNRLQNASAGKPHS